ncbi:MAG: ACT domain-containing protein [Pseudomonadota bacterium]
MSEQDVVASGETDLRKLLAGLTCARAPETYVFITTSIEVDEAALAPIMRFVEDEGTTYIATLSAAEAQSLAYTFPCTRITLDVHSALEAVGFLAHIATRLAQAGMGVNPVAGYFHDHLFVPEDRADDAVRILEDVQREAAGSGSTKG